MDAEVWQRGKKHRLWNQIKLGLNSDSCKEGAVTLEKFEFSLFFLFVCFEINFTLQESHKNNAERP